MRKYAIVGSRTYVELPRVVHFVNQLDDDAVVFSGGARGVDSTAEYAALERGLHVKSWRPRQAKNGLWLVDVYVDGRFAHVMGRVYGSFARAAFGRNADIVKEADVVVAFWDGESHGTLDTIERARQAQKELVVFSEE